jgi:cyclase
MDRDGTQIGYDLDMLQAITQAVSIPVIASGGAGNMEHFYQALTVGGADAALAASLFHYDKIRIPDLKSYLQSHGVITRLNGWEGLDAFAR